MNYGAGYKATYNAAIIDPRSWAETTRLEIISGNIKRQSTGIRQTADITVSDFDQSRETWVRVFMDARQDENVTREAIFTGVVSSPQKAIDGATVTKPLECYSVLKPCDDIQLQRGWYVAAGRNGASAIKELLAVSPAPVVVDGIAPELAAHIVAESGDTNLSMIDRILEAINWRLTIKGDGTIVLGPKPVAPKITFDAKSMDIIEASLTVTRDWFSCPNVFRATSGDASAEERDDDPASPMSTVSRGREIIMAEDDVTLASDEGIAEYAARRLREEQQVAELADYARRFVPGLNVGDIVKIAYAEITGEYTIDEQQIELTHNGRTTERVSRSATEGDEFKMPPIKRALIILPGNYYFVMPDSNKVLVPYNTMQHR